MVSQHKLISYPTASALPSPQSCSQYAICTCSSSILKPCVGHIHLNFLFSIIIVNSTWRSYNMGKKRNAVSNSLSLTPLLASHPPLSFFNWQRLLTVSAWCLMGEMSWSVLHGWPNTVGSTIIWLEWILAGLAYP